MFRNELVIGIVVAYLGFIASSHAGAVEVERSIVWVARVDACVVTVSICLTQREAQGGQREKFYADT